MSVIVQNKYRKYQWTILFSAMLLIVLFFGLQPIGWSNDVQWLPDLKAIRFQNNGIAFVENLPSALLHKQPNYFSIEMVVKPGNLQRKGFVPILLIHDGDDSRQLAIWQYRTSLIVMNGDDYNNQKRWPRVVAKNTFSSQQLRYVSITSGAHGTRLYVNGKLAATKADWKLSIPSAGGRLRLVLGNSVYGKHGWAGDLLGLVISGKAFTSQEVGFRLDRWIADDTFFVKRGEPLLHFAFNQKSGNQFLDQSMHDCVLEVPSRMVVLERKILDIPWKQLNWSRSNVVDMLLNTLGFMPLGYFFCGFLHYTSGLFRNHKKLIAVTFCMLLSLGIELSQVWIPMRVSSLLDLILNTFGAWLGSLFWDWLGEEGYIG